MAARGQPIAVYYVAWDSVNGVMKTGDSANHTIYLVKDGGTPTLATNSPTECSSAEQPGLYQVQTVTAESTCWSLSCGGVSSSTGIILWPSFVTFEVPTATVVTAIWEDTTAGGDFGTAGSIGKLIATTGITAAAVTGAVGSVTSPVSVSLTQTLNAARALDSIADTSLTLNDAFHSAIASAAGQQTTSGTSYVVSTPHTATVLRTFTLTLVSPPSTVPSARS